MNLHTLHLLRLMAVILGIGYATAAFWVGHRFTHDQWAFGICTLMAGCCFYSALQIHERMNDLRKRGGSR